ncbi:DUF29 domain-containing protein [Candidatus Venteria ishoeyi]|uniref:DUF29 domain-containing protein n=1 Tax=Candidatus Venteria ishoeyi TaxID=1899563 RepID=UPI0025A4E1C1|nr:DUF29 domain-containing protein [Candidatus Venteria ishoeyi]MDM8546487.1 DUF29 domain-containing protein [Candidatus Venteria ishoeyi]
MDIVHIAEELESMGKRDRRVLLSRLQVLLMYLLKWKYQAQFQGRSWLATIDHQRDEIEQILIDSPSLRNALSDTLPDIYKKAVRDAKRETGLPEKTFPVLCLFELDSILCQGYYPEAG